MQARDQKMDISIVKRVVIEDTPMIVEIQYNQQTLSGAFSFRPENVNVNPTRVLVGFKNPIRALKDIANVVLETPMRFCRMSTGSDDKRRRVFIRILRRNGFIVRDYGRFFTFTRTERHNTPL